MLNDRDFRKLPISAQAEVRRVAVNMVLGGRKRIDVAEAVCVNRRFVGEWMRTYEAHGSAALAGGKRGRRPGEQKALNRHQEAMIRRMIASRCPDQLELPFALWTREAVGQIIERKTGISLSLTAIGSYLAAWSFTPQKPIRRATERNEAAIQGCDLTCRDYNVSQPRCAPSSRRPKYGMLHDTNNVTYLRVRLVAQLVGQASQRWEIDKLDRPPL
jgi:transposase